ncbi:MAG: DNA repair protein RecN [Pseudomonadota bacterium]
MLHTLCIKDFVLVDNLELCIEPSLTILTGETGAGKSIIVDALSLALGGRADSGVIRQGAQQTEITAAFEPNKAAQQWMIDAAIQNDDGECMMRRIIGQNGRSRAYINGHLVTIQALRDLGEKLVDIHSQHAHQSLLKTDVQRDLLDAGLSEKYPTAVKLAYTGWKALKQELDDMGGDAADRDAQLTLLRYQVDELDALDITAEELETLDEEHRRLAHANQILSNAQTALELLDGDNHGSALGSLNQASRELAEVQQHDDKLDPINELLENAIINAQETAQELQHYMDRLEIDPARLAEIEQRIQVTQDTARKHKVAVDEIPAHHDELRRQLDNLAHYEQRAAALEARVQQAQENWQKTATALSKQRKTWADKLAKQITSNMRQLGMPNGRVEIQVAPQADIAPVSTGMDKVEFLVSMNPGQEPKPLAKVASGGELSRISLAIQVITAQDSGVATLVFDEVDVGVGGGVAEIVGRQLSSLGDKRQVLCITHLPQVAAYGRQHLFVSKQSGKNNTQTAVNALDLAEREQEVARMLGGLNITEQTLAHAREMLATAGATTIPN